MPITTIQEALQGDGKATVVSIVEEVIGKKYIDTHNPTTQINPPAVGAEWVNVVSGELFVCIDASANTNVWAGQLGTTIGTKIDSLFAYYKLQGDLEDSSLNNNPLTLTSGNLAWVEDEIKGTVIEFDQDECYLDATIPPIKDGMYMEAMIRLDTVSGSNDQGAFANCNNEGEHLLGLLSKDSQGACYYNILTTGSGGSGNFDSDGSITDGLSGWFKTRVEKYNGSVSLYYNSTLISTSGDNSQDGWTDPTPLRVGRAIYNSNSNNGQFYGRMCELKIGKL